MDDAKRSAELWLPRKKLNYINLIDTFNGFKLRIKKYPYMGVTTMSLGSLILFISGVAISIN